LLHLFEESLINFIVDHHKRVLNLALNGIKFQRQYFIIGV
jgi:hypothetical protein